MLRIIWSYRLLISMTFQIFGLKKHQKISGTIKKQILIPSSLQQQRKVVLELLFCHLFVRFVSFNRNVKHFRTQCWTEARTGRMNGGNVVVGLLCQFILQLETFIVSIDVSFILKVIGHPRVSFLFFILDF